MDKLCAVLVRSNQKNRNHVSTRNRISCRELVTEVVEN